MSVWAWRRGGLGLGELGDTAAGLALPDLLKPSVPSLPSKILTRRANLLTETATLQKENSELRLLLGEYLRSR